MRALARRTPSSRLFVQITGGMSSGDIPDRSRRPLNRSHLIIVDDRPHTRHTGRLSNYPSVAQELEWNPRELDRQADRNRDGSLRPKTNRQRHKHAVGANARGFPLRLVRPSRSTLPANLDRKLHGDPYARSEVVHAIDTLIFLSNRALHSLTLFCHSCKASTVERTSVRDRKAANRTMPQGCSATTRPAPIARSSLRPQSLEPFSRTSIGRGGDYLARPGDLASSPSPPQRRPPAVRRKGRPLG